MMVGAALDILRFLNNPQVGSRVLLRTKGEDTQVLGTVAPSYRPGQLTSISTLNLFMPHAGEGKVSLLLNAGDNSLKTKCLSNFSITSERNIKKD